jgi:hypothetical protein
MIDVDIISVNLVVHSSMTLIYIVVALLTNVVDIVAEYKAEFG